MVNRCCSSSRVHSTLEHTFLQQLTQVASFFMCIVYCNKSIIFWKVFFRKKIFLSNVIILFLLFSWKNKKISHIRGFFQIYIPGAIEQNINFQIINHYRWADNQIGQLIPNESTKNAEFWLRTMYSIKEYTGQRVALNECWDSTWKPKDRELP